MRRVSRAWQSGRGARVAIVGGGCLSSVILLFALLFCLVLYAAVTGKAPKPATVAANAVTTAAAVSSPTDAPTPTNGATIEVSPTPVPPPTVPPTATMIPTAAPPTSIPPTPTAEPPTPTPAINPAALQVGYVGKLWMPGDTPLLVAIDAPSLDALIAAAAAHDDEGFKELLLNGRLFLVPLNTTVRVLDVGLFKTRVRILDGQRAGLSGWVPSEYVR
jgi:hypothetical protein